MNNKYENAIMDIEKIKSVIPHREPFLLIDKIHSITLDKSIIASHLLSKDEPIFQGHFPNLPIYPGVYYIESIAQAGAVLIFESRKANGIFDTQLGVLSSVEKARFRKTTAPGNLLIFEVELEKTKGPFFWFSGKVFVDNEVVAEISLSVALKS